jgi:hypothetical protein
MNRYKRDERSVVGLGGTAAEVVPMLIPRVFRATEVVPKEMNGYQDTCGIHTRNFVVFRFYCCGAIHFCP